jgi:hypothetical protein
MGTPAVSQLSLQTSASLPQESDKALARTTNSVATQTLVSDWQTFILTPLEIDFVAQDLSHEEEDPWSAFETWAKNVEDSRTDQIPTKNGLTRLEHLASLGWDYCRGIAHYPNRKLRDSIQRINIADKMNLELLDRPPNNLDGDDLQRSVKLLGTIKKIVQRVSEMKSDDASSSNS